MYVCARMLICVCCVCARMLIYVCACVYAFDCKLVCINVCVRACLYLSVSWYVCVCV